MATLSYFKLRTSLKVSPHFELCCLKSVFYIPFVEKKQQQQTRTRMKKHILYRNSNVRDRLEDKQFFAFVIVGLITVFNFWRVTETNHLLHFALFHSNPASVCVSHSMVANETSKPSLSFNLSPWCHTHDMILLTIAAYHYFYCYYYLCES